MSDISAKDVQTLRKATGAGMMDAKRALVETGGDFDAAATWLREQGLAKAASRSDRDNSEGTVAAAVVDGSAAIVELKSETDFVAKSDRFVDLANQLATLVASDGEGAVEARSGDIDDLRITLKENVELGRVIRFEGGADAVLDAYVHRQAGRGVNAVLVELDGGTEELAHDIALHIASARPDYLSVDEVPADAVEAERTTLENISRNEGKPEAALPKIVEGRLRGWYAERVLLEQKFVKDEKQTIRDILGGASIRRFAQVEIGR
jgi:elongation factor Ts